MQGVEHEAVAAERNQDPGLFGCDEIVALAKHRLRRLRDVALRSNQPDPERLQVPGTSVGSWMRVRVQLFSSNKHDRLRA
jgi:hypothetical protein